MPAVIESAPLMTEDEAAAFLGIKPNTLAVWRCTGRHALPFVRVGRLVRYRREQLERWLAARQEGDTGEDND